jgi:hypothetical protein
VRIHSCVVSVSIDIILIDVFTEGTPISWHFILSHKSLLIASGRWWVTALFTFGIACLVILVPIDLQQVRLPLHRRVIPVDTEHQTCVCSLCVSVKRHSICKLNRYMCVPQEKRKKELKEEQMMVGE